MIGVPPDAVELRVLELATLPADVQRNTFSVRAPESGAPPVLLARPVPGAIVVLATVNDAATVPRAVAAI